MVSSFSSLILQVVNFLLRKKIITVSRLTTLRVLLMETSVYPTTWGNWGGGGSPCKSKSEDFPLLLDKNITYWEIPNIWKKGIFNSFQISFNKNFACSVHSVTQLWLIWKSSIKTKSFNKKPCPAGLSAKIICQASPFLPNPFPWTFMGNPGDGEKSYPTAKNLLTSPISSFAVKSFISSPSNSSFQVIILCNLYL